MMDRLSSIAVILITLLFAGFFAGSETAVISCSKVRLRSRAKKGCWRARVLERMIASPEKFFSIVLVGTNLSVIICTATATALFIDLLGDSGALVATVVMTPLLLVFGEVIPKSSYLYHADTVSILAAPFLKLMSYILWPAVFPSTILAGLLTGFSREEEKRYNILSTREELVFLYSRGKEDGSIERREKRMIDRVFNFGVLTAGEMMIPMDEVVSFPVTASVDEVIDETASYPYSRYPLISPDNGQVVGIISLIDLLGLYGGERLATVMHSPFFAREDELAEKLLIRIKDDPHHFAVITDESGAARGILTLENILENIVGDISSEYQ